MSNDGLGGQSPNPSFGSDLNRQVEMANRSGFVTFNTVPYSAHQPPTFQTINPIMDGVLKTYMVPPDIDQEVARLRSLVKSLREDVLTRERQLSQQSQLNQAAAKEHQETRAKLSEAETKLSSIEELAYLSSRICSEASERLGTSAELKEKFNRGVCDAFVLSVDIRGSTTLMLKARSPERFAQFINSVVQAFKEIIIAHHGVYDKFTGDGVLAFFPDFYSGAGSGYYAVHAALKCHSAFKQIFDNSRTSFTAVRADAGIGIGIDFGKVHLLRMAEGLTVVGEPVVYACRLGGAPVGATLLNQPAFEQLQGSFGGEFHFKETSLDFKNEGPMLAYSVVGKQNLFDQPSPGWRELLEDESRRGEMNASTPKSQTVTESSTTSEGSS